MTGPADERGRSDLLVLAAFLLAVLAVLLVVPVALQFAGVDVREPREEPPAGSVNLAVLGVEGTAIDDERTSVGAVRVVVANVGDGAVDPSELTATWVGNGSYGLAAAGGDAEGEGTFAVEPVDGDREDAALRDREGAVLTFDLGTDDVDGAEEFGDRLRAGETATVTVVSPDGSTATADLFAPDPLPAGESVAL